MNRDFDIEHSDKVIPKVFSSRIENSAQFSSMHLFTYFYWWRKRSLGQIILLHSQPLSYSCYEAYRDE